MAGERGRGAREARRAALPRAVVQLRSAGEAPVGLVGGGAAPDSIAALTTDADGRAAASVRLGDRAGGARVIVSAPAFPEALDSVMLTVAAGGFSSVLTKDTVVTVGATFRLPATAVDRAGNVRPDSLDHSGREADSVLAVQRDGRATGIRPGRALYWAVSRGRLGPTAQAWVTVVPAGTLALTWDSGGLVIAPTDGARSRPVGTGTVNTLREPAWSPDGSTLAVVMGELGTLDPATGAFRFVETPGVSAVHWPAWSPDGAWIYFQGDEGQGARIYRVHPNGTGSERVMDDSAAMPAPSPDGATLAYVGAGGLRLLDLGTRTSRPAPQPAGDLSPRTPRWSPDGRFLAFVARDYRIGLSPLDGSPVRVLNGSFGEGICWLDSRWIAATPPRPPVPYVVPVQLGPAGPVQVVDTRSGEVLTVPALRAITPSCKPQ